MSISQFAQISPEAKIGKDVEIGPFTTIYGDVVIGDGCKIGPNVTIYDGARLGDRVTVFPGAVISAIPQDLKFRGEETTAQIGNDTVIRECATVHRGTASKGTTIIGQHCLIMAYCHVAHDCVVGNNVIMSNATQLAGEVVVDDFAVIGGGTLVHQFCHLGAHIMIQGGALINKDVPPFVKAAREPICYTGVNTVGLRRRGFDNDKIREIQDIYRHLYLSGVNISEAVGRIRANLPETPEREEILSFVTGSQRGVIKGYM